jgi:hypothetical protein
MQEYGTTAEKIYPFTLQNNGFADGTEGRLQMAVLVLSIMAVAMSMLSLWGFILLRILALFYVRKQVATTLLPLLNADPALTLSNKGGRASRRSVVRRDTGLVMQVAAIKAGERPQVPRRRLKELDALPHAQAFLTGDPAVPTEKAQEQRWRHRGLGLQPWLLAEARRSRVCAEAMSSGLV